MARSNNDRVQLDFARHRALDVASQFPDSLTGAELEQVTRRIERVLSSIEEMRRYPLDNGDEPAPVFRPIGKEQP